jgi:sugar phosphate isomerase/epimerase
VSLISSTLFLQCRFDDDGRSNRWFTRIDDYFITITGDYASHLEALGRCVRLCDMFDTDKLRTFGFINESPMDDDDAVAKIFELLREPVETVEKAGLVLAMENCPHTYLQFGSLTRRVIDRIGSPHFRALWDPANAMRSGGVPFPQDYGCVRGSVVHVHAKDIAMEGGMHMVPLGEGVIDYSGILKSLREDGFGGVISLEPEYMDPKGGRPEGVRRSLVGIKSILKSLDIA